MNKNELITAAAEASGLDKQVVGASIDAITTIVEQQLTAGDSVVLAGFGTFEARHRAARAGRNPQTGAPIDIAAANVPAFKPAASLKRAVKGS